MNRYRVEKFSGAAFSWAEGGGVREYSGWWVWDMHRGVEVDRFPTFCEAISAATKLAKRNFGGHRKPPTKGVL